MTLELSADCQPKILARSLAFPSRPINLLEADSFCSHVSHAQLRHRFSQKQGVAQVWVRETNGSWDQYLSISQLVRRIWTDERDISPASNSASEELQAGFKERDAWQQSCDLAAIPQIVWAFMQEIPSNTSGIPHPQVIKSRI